MIFIFNDNGKTMIDLTRVKCITVKETTMEIEFKDVEFISSVIEYDDPELLETDLDELILKRDSTAIGGKVFNLFLPVTNPSSHLLAHTSNIAAVSKVKDELSLDVIFTQGGCKRLSYKEKVDVDSIYSQILARKIMEEVK